MVASGRGRTGTSRRGAPDDRRDDRPFLIALFGLLVVIGAMAIGPLRSLAAANDRVDDLTRERDVIAEEVEELEQQRNDLNDPDEQEIYAREQLGFVKPGEVPYIVLPDPGGEAADEPAVGEGADDGSDPPWYTRLADALTSLFGG